MLKQVALSVQGMSHSFGTFGELGLKHGCAIKLAECKDLDSRGMILLLEVDGHDQYGLIKDIQKTPGVRHVYWASNTGKNTLAMVAVDTPLFCGIAKSTGALCRSCPLTGSQSEGSGWRLLVRDVSSLRRCVEMLEQHGHHAEITEVSNAIRNDILTPRQKEIIKEAMRLGYFNFPRRTDLTELAKRLSVKPSTLTEILRRAEGKIVNYYLDSNAAA